MNDPTNDAPVTVRYLSDRFKWAAPGDRQFDVWLVRFDDADVRDMVFEGPEAESEAWAAWERHAPGYNMRVFRLAALASAPAGDGVPHGLGPSASTFEDDADGFAPVAMLRGRCVYIQQGGAQITLSSDVAERLAAALARPHSAVAPAGDGVEDRDALAERLCAARFPTTVARHPDYYRVQLTEESRERWRVVADAALARPRAAVGEREEIEQLRDAITRLLPYAEIEAAKEPTTDGRVKRMLAARKDRDHARSILALQSPRAAVGEREAIDAILQITNLEEAQIAQEPRFVLEMAQEALDALQSPPSKVEGECPSSPDGRHQVDTTMESGACNCFHCEAPMGGAV